MIPYTSAFSSTISLTSSARSDSVASKKRGRTQLADRFVKGHDIDTLLPLSKKPRVYSWATNEKSCSSPGEYLSTTLTSCGVEPRRSPFSEQAARFFLPYTERSQIRLEVLRAIRQKDKRVLGELDELKPQSLREERNIFGETLAHLVCRWGMLDMFTYLVVDLAAVSLNVKDCHGRSPLHNACMAHRPNWALVGKILKEEPELMLYPDDFGALPFDYIQPCYHSECVGFLSDTRGAWLDKLY